MHTTRSRLAAGLVAAAAALSLPVAAANADTPPIVPVKVQKLKFILPPRDSPFYQQMKDDAIAAGYDVLENDGRTPAT